jgi:hypothetical protein
MKHRNLALGRVAIFATAAAFVAAPCFAQSSARYSTPQEQAQTQNLNAQQASEPGFIVPAQSSTPGPSNADVAAYNASVAEANAQAQARYQAQLKDYQNRKNVYDAQREAYRQDLDAYTGAPPVLEEHHVIIGTPAVVAVVPDRHVVLAFPDQDRSLVSLDDIASPDRELGGAPVEDRAGQRVGYFQYQTFQDGGREKSVITLHNNKNIALNSDHLRFDSDNDTVVADLTYDELNSMPARF